MDRAPGEKSQIQNIYRGRAPTYRIRPLTNLTPSPAPPHPLTPLEKSKMKHKGDVFDFSCLKLTICPAASHSSPLPLLSPQSQFLIIDAWIVLLGQACVSEAYFLLGEDPKLQCVHFGSRSTSLSLNAGTGFEVSSKILSIPRKQWDKPEKVHLLRPSSLR